MGTACWHQPSAALARPGQTAAGPRSSRPRLRLVRRGLRPARLEGGQGAAGAAQGMSEIRKWLEAIGLGQYAAAFETKEIGMDLLAQVDDQMLKDIGVSVGGHRLRIRNAIAKLATAPVAEVNLS